MKKNKYTKQSIEALLTLMSNLATEAWNIGDEICKAFAPNGDDDIYELVTEIQECSKTDIGEIMKELEKKGYFRDARIEDGPECSPVHVNVIHWDQAELSRPIDGGELVAYTWSSDCDTRSVGMMYLDMDGDPVDIALAEQKRGEIAEANGMKTDNRDIDVYVYEDVSTEDWTRKFTLRMDDIDAVLNHGIKPLKTAEPQPGVTKTFRVYGFDGHRQRASFCDSVDYDWSADGETRKVSFNNSNRTGTNAYTEVVITRNDEAKVYGELEGQISDGYFENCRTGRVTEVMPDGSENQV